MDLVLSERHTLPLPTVARPTYLDLFAKKRSLITGLL
jgi:hypothetical protein